MEALAGYGSSSEDGEDGASAQGGRGGAPGGRGRGEHASAAAPPSPPPGAKRARRSPTPAAEGRRQGKNEPAYAQPQPQQPHGPGPPGTGTTDAASGSALDPPRPVRSFPHVEGNYSTAVYVKLPQHRAVSRLFDELLASLPSGGASGLPRFYPLFPPSSGPAAAQGLPPPPPPGAAPQVPPHISLSRTVPIRLETAKPLLASLQRCLRAAAAAPAAGGGGRPGAAAVLAMGGVRAFANDERTRTFAALGVERGAEEVVRLIRAVDAAFAEHGLPVFYEDPQPHASFAWAPGDHADALERALRAAPPPPAPRPALDVPLAQVVCRVGQRESVVWTAPLR